MPLYQYRCECGASFESLERIGAVRETCEGACVAAADHALREHGHVERVISGSAIRGDGREAKEPTFDPCARSNRPGGPCH